MDLCCKRCARFVPHHWLAAVESGMVLRREEGNRNGSENDAGSVVIKKRKRTGECRDANRRRAVTV